MRRRESVSSELTDLHAATEARPDARHPTSPPAASDTEGAGEPELRPTHDRGSAGRKRERDRVRRRFLGTVSGLEPKPLFSGMTLDSVGLNFIAAHELGPETDQAGSFTKTSTGPSGGFAAVPYNNPAGNAAIGYGHLLHEGNVDATDQANYPKPIDQAQANALLVKDTAKAVAAVNNDVKVVLTQDQFDAMVDFTFNEGTDAFAKSTLLKDVNSSLFSQVPAQLEQWVYGTVNGQPAVIPGLVYRRNDESNLFEGQTTKDSTGDGPATGFSARNPGETFAGIHNHGCSPGSGETGTGGGTGNIGGGGGHHTVGGGHGTPILIINIRILNILQGYTTWDGYSSFGGGTIYGGSSPYAGSSPVNGNSAPYGTSPFCYSAPVGASPYNDYYSITGSSRWRWWHARLWWWRHRRWRWRWHCRGWWRGHCRGWWQWHRRRRRWHGWRWWRQPSVVVVAVALLAVVVAERATAAVAATQAVVVVAQAAAVAIPAEAAAIRVVVAVEARVAAVAMSLSIAVPAARIRAAWASGPAASAGTSGEVWARARPVLTAAAALPTAAAGPTFTEAPS